MRPMLFALAALMAVVILVSNLLVVSFIIPNWMTWATITFPFAFLVTDLANRYLGAQLARLVVLVGFALGVVLSIVAGDPRVGVASGAAFLIAQMMDVSIFDALRRGPIWQAPLISTVVASVIDTALFYWLAFGTVPLVGWQSQPWNWIPVGFADLGVKLIMALTLLPLYLLIVRQVRLKPMSRSL